MNTESKTQVAIILMFIVLALIIPIFIPLILNIVSKAGNDASGFYFQSQQFASQFIHHGISIYGV
jgi:uncharacterized membrane protein (DUF106 family)